MPRPLASFSLDAHRALAAEGRKELSEDCTLRGTKAAELALSLLTALGVGESTLSNARVLYPFFCFLMPPVRDLRSSLPRRLRGYWDALLTGELIAAREDLMHWQASVKTAVSIFGEPAQGGLLPYPSVQVTVNPDRSVLLTCLTGDCTLEKAVPSEISHRVKCAERNNQPRKGDEVLLLGHFDPHGLAMMAASYLHLEALGVKSIRPVCGYEETGDYGKFWKRTLPRLVADNGQFTHAVIVDVTVYSRDHQRTIRGLRAAAEAGVQVHLVDHHLDTLECVPEMLNAGAEVTLADIPGCFYGDEIARHNLPYSLLGALGDRDIPTRHWIESDGTPSSSLHRTLNDALSNITGLMYSISPPPRELRKLPAFPAQNIVERASDGIERFAANLKRICKDGYAVPVKPGEKPAATHDGAFARGQHWHVPKFPDQSDVILEDLEVAVLGGVVLVTEQLPLLGRRWYEALEKLLALHEEPHYALAGRFLTGSGFNFLCLKDWRKLTLPPPLAFVPEEERAQTVGHYGAFWFNLGEAAVAEGRLTAFIKAVNRYLGVKGGRVQSAVRRTLLKVLEAPPKKKRP